MTMTKEYRLELKQLAAEEKQIRKSVSKMDRDCDREIARLNRELHKLAKAIDRRRSKEGSGAAKLLARIANRRAILEGRLS